MPNFLLRQGAGSPQLLHKSPSRTRDEHDIHRRHDHASSYGNRDSAASAHDHRDHAPSHDNRDRAASSHGSRDGAADVRRDTGDSDQAPTAALAHTITGKPHAPPPHSRPAHCARDTGTTNQAQTVSLVHLIVEKINALHSTRPLLLAAGLLSLFPPSDAGPTRSLPGHTATAPAHPAHAAARHHPYTPPLVTNACPRRAPTPFTRLTPAPTSPFACPILCANVDGLNPRKWASLLRLAGEHQAVILVLTETHLPPHIISPTSLPTPAPAPSPADT
jgi:hypothetical protein